MPTKKTPAPARRKRGKATTAPARADGLRPGSKMAQMIDLALRPQGASEAEICKALGWKTCRVTLKRTADKIGAKLDSTKISGETVYKAVMPKKVKAA